MPVYLISYNLIKPDHDYQPLYDALNGVNARHIQDSVCGVRTRSDSSEVFDYLWKFMHNQLDRLFVIPFDKDKDYRAENSIQLLKSI